MNDEIYIHIIADTIFTKNNSEMFVLYCDLNYTSNIQAQHRKTSDNVCWINLLYLLSIPSTSTALNVYAWALPWLVPVIIIIAITTCIVIVTSLVIVAMVTIFGFQS